MADMTNTQQPQALAATPLSDIHGPLAGTVADFAPNAQDPRHIIDVETGGPAFGSFQLPQGLHPDTAKLVCDFASAMAKKLRASEVKHGWTANWMRPDWRDELAAELLRHVHKGDPIDVAAYAAFAWFHGWSVAPAEASATSGGQTLDTIVFGRALHLVAEMADLARQDAERHANGDPYANGYRDGLARASKLIGGAVEDAEERARTAGLTPDLLGEWRLWWQGSIERGDHIMEVDRFGRYVREIAWIGDQHHDKADEIVRAHNEALSTARALAPPAGGTPYDPLRRIDYPEGRFGPAMLDTGDEMTGKELKLIAKSHGFDLHLKVEEWEGEAGEIIERDGSFAEALEATCPAQGDKDGYQLVGAWDDEDGDLVLAYVCPLTVDAKSEGSANG